MKEQSGVSLLTGTCSWSTSSFMARIQGPRGLGPSIVGEPIVDLSRSSLADAPSPPFKRHRVLADPLIFERCEVDDGDRTFRRHVSIDALPDECLFEILKRLAGRRERCVAALVSKRWLMLLSTISSCGVAASGDDCQRSRRRSFEGEAATDVRLAAMAVGAGNCLELLIRGSKRNPARVTDAGLSAICRGLPSLRVLSMWNCPSVSEEGLVHIASGCPILEKLDLCKCPGVSDRGIVAISSGCQKLSTLTIESCVAIGDEGLQAVGLACPNLKSISITECPLVSDRGVAGLFSPYSSTVEKIKLQGLNISDASLAILGLHGKSVVNLALAFLQNVTERGFWVMASAGGLQKLNSLAISSCGGVTDLSIEAIGKCFPLLKNVCLRRCLRLTDAGLKAFATAAGSLESLRLEDCRRLSLHGVLDAILSCRSSDKLRALTLAGCMDLRETDDFHPEFFSSSPSYPSLKFLSIRRCRGFGDSGLATVAKLCPQLRHIDFYGNVEVTEGGLLTLLDNGAINLVTVNIGGCVHLTDEAVAALARRHGDSLRNLSLEGCPKVTDKSLFAIADFCMVLEDLDVSGSAVTDEGVAALASSMVLDLQVLSLSGCPMISEQSVCHITSLGPSLVGLGLKQCSSIGRPAMDALQNTMWWCDILH